MKTRRGKITAEYVIFVYNVEYTSINDDSFPWYQITPNIRFERLQVQTKCFLNGYLWTYDISYQCYATEIWLLKYILMNQCHVDQCHLVEQYYLTRQQFHHDNFLSFSHKLHRDISLVQGVHKNGSYSPSHKLVKDTFWLWKEPKKCKCCLSTLRKWGNLKF